MQLLLQKFVVGITAISMAIAGFLGFTPKANVDKLETKISALEQQLGAFTPVSGQRYSLWGSGISSSATTLDLNSLTMLISGRELIMGDFGEIGYATIEPGTSNMEFISFTGITQDGSSSKATLTGASRGLSPVSPYNASTTLQKAHSGGAVVIFSNSPAYYAEFAVRRNNESIWGDWTFSATNTAQYNGNPSFSSASNELVTVKFAQDQANQGAATMSTTTAGLGILATSDILIHFTTTTYGASSTPYVVRAYDFATSTDKRGATTTGMLTKSDGQMSTTFLPLDETVAWTGEHSHSATSTFTNDIDAVGFDLDSAQASTTISNVLSITGITTFNASTSFYGATSTFANIPSLPERNPTGNYQIASKKYVDDNTSPLIAVATSTNIVANAAGIPILNGTIPGTTLSVPRAVNVSLYFNIYDVSGGGDWDGTIAVTYQGSTVFSTSITQPSGADPDFIGFYNATLVLSTSSDEAIRITGSAITQMTQTSVANSSFAYFPTISTVDPNNAVDRVIAVTATGKDADQYIEFVSAYITLIQ